MKLCQAEAAVISHGDGTVVLPLDAVDPRPVVLNGAAALVWHTLAVARDEDEVAHDLALELGLELAAIRDDVVGCLADLAEIGLVQRATD